MRKILNFTAIFLVIILIGCSSDFERTKHGLDYETTSKTKLGAASQVKGYKPATLNLIKYKEDNGDKVAYKFQLSAEYKKQTPAFRAGSGMVLILNDFEQIKLNSIDGEVNVYFHEGEAVRAAYYDVNINTLRKITKAKKIRFLAEGKAYNVAGELSRANLKLFRKLLEEDED